jgi:hypothetical protein
MRKCALFLVLAIVGTALAEQAYLRDPKERERLGLTPEEWDVCKILNISKPKLKQLLSTGITVHEYSQAPWYAMGVTEDEWIALRRKGLVDQDIKAVNKVERQEDKTEHGLVVLSFFLPGYGHFRLDKKPIGYGLSGVAVASLGLYVVHKKKVPTPTGFFWRRRPEYLGLCLVDCLLSAGDVWRRTRYDDNPELQRFSLLAGNGRIELRWAMNL